MTDVAHSAKHGPKLEPAIIVIIGITGDLSRRYLLPSLYHLIKDGLLDDKTEIVGITRGTLTAEELLDEVTLCGKDKDNVCDPQALKTMHARTTMIQMDLTSSADYASLHKKLDAIEESNGVCMNRLYYLSIPPQVYMPVIRLLGEQGLNTSCQHGRAMTRLLVEKPFGFNLKSAEELIAETGEVFGEEQVYRIDHYLAKETVQNILTFRFQNPIFEALWSQQYIAGISISANEKIDIEGRVAFYEPLGALRDFIQSHLLQVLAIVTMDKPDVFDSEHIHMSKQAVMDQIQPVPADKVSERVIRGQYVGYREEVNNAESVTETYAAVTVYIDSPRWQGVPIRLSTGKALAERKTEVRVSFHGATGEANNHLRFRIQPNEGIELDLLTKKPGFNDELQTTAMDFSYKHDFENHGHPDAYERVLVDAVRGDHTLFATSEEVLASWRVLQPVVNEWAKRSDDIVFYKPGTTDLEAPSAKT
jgi:glucose-6-phosphate 1-dehydrogenase